MHLLVVVIAKCNYKLKTPARLRTTHIYTRITISRIGDPVATIEFHAVRNITPIKIFNQC